MIFLLLLNPDCLQDIPRSKLGGTFFCHFFNRQFSDHPRKQNQIQYPHWISGGTRMSSEILRRNTLWARPSALLFSSHMVLTKELWEGTGESQIKRLRMNWRARVQSITTLLAVGANWVLATQPEHSHCYWSFTNRFLCVLHCYATRNAA